MAKQLEYKLEDGSSVVVEVSEGSSGGTIRSGTRGVGEKVEQAKETLQEALQGLKPVVNALQKTLNDINNPDEIAVEFGVKMGGKTGIVIASVESEINFKIALKWSNK